MKQKVLMTPKEWIQFFSFKFPCYVLEWHGHNYEWEAITLQMFADEFMISTVQCNNETGLIFNLTDLINIQKQYF